MFNVGGMVIEKSPDGKKIKLDNGEKYSAFAPAMLMHVNVGDTVSFSYAENPGKGAYEGTVFKNIKGTVSKSGGSPGVSSAPPTGGHVPSGPSVAVTKPGDPPIHYQRTIIRQSAIKAAIDIHGTFPSSDEEEFSTYMTILLETAQQIEAWTSGDSDMEAVKKELGVE